MPSFPRPDLADEKVALDSWFLKRKVPRAQSGRLLLACWNIANLGEQKRDPKDLELIAHLMSRFDLIAIADDGNMPPKNSMTALLPIR